MNNLTTRQYDIGDEVIVRSWFALTKEATEVKYSGWDPGLPVLILSSGVHVQPGMKRYCDRRARITEKHPDLCRYRLDIDEEQKWWWPPEALLPYIEPGTTVWVWDDERESWIEKTMLTIIDPQFSRYPVKVVGTTPFTLGAFTHVTTENPYAKTDVEGEEKEGIEPVGFKALKALIASARLWERRAEGVDITVPGSQTCPCCLEYAPRKVPHGDKCTGCPIYADTGKRGCAGTPFVGMNLVARYMGRNLGPDQQRSWREGARAEADYLWSLVDRILAPEDLAGQAQKT